MKNSTNQGHRFFIATRFESFISSLRLRSEKKALWPFVFGESCCGEAMKRVLSKGVDLIEWSYDLSDYAPEEADLLIIVSPMNKVTAEVVEKVYNQMLHPKWVIRMGHCQVGKNEEIVKCPIPVDVDLAACPPTGEQIKNAFVQLQAIIKAHEGK